MIISRSYFKGEIKIPNAEDTAPNSNLLGNVSKLELFIEEYERDVLVKCLGYPLFREFQSELDSENSNGIKSTSQKKWDDLLNGKDYQINGKPVKWRGLIFEEGKLKQSLIAYYVFCEFLNKDLVGYRGVGVQKEKVKNSIHVSADPLYVASYRKFHSLTEISDDCSGLKSLYDFILDMNNINSETYANWLPKKFENVNIFGV